jgi:hypothetical protein
VVSINFLPSPVIHACRSTGARTPRSPRRPLSVPSVVDAQAAPLNPWVCARLLQLRVEPTRARNDALQRDLGRRRRTLRRAPPHSGESAATLLARVLGRAIRDGRTISRTPLCSEAGPPWTRRPRPRRGPRLAQPLDPRSTARIASNPGSNLSIPVSWGNFD